MDNNKKKIFILNAIFIVTVIGCIIGISYTLSILTPFVLGFIIACALKPITLFLTKWTKFRRKGAAIFVTTIFYTAISVLIGFIIVLIFGQVKELIITLPDIYFMYIEPTIKNVGNFITKFFAQLSPQISNSIETSFQNLTLSFTNIMTEFSSKLINGVTGVAKNIPLFLLTLIFTIVSSILISVDYNKVTSFFLRQFTPNMQKILLESKSFLINTVFKMVKAYIIILSITFIEAAIGLMLLGTEYAITLAVIIASFDILPFLGTGGIMIPWAIYSLVSGNVPFGVGLLILYAIITIVRNIIEPKIVGKSIGLHPLVTVTSMYGGLRLLGFLGLFFAPMIVLLVKHLNEEDLIHLYKE